METSAVKILVVDDKETMRLLLSEGLQADGYIVETAENGEVALTKIDEFNPQVILLDVMMPGIPGNELVGIIKKKSPKAEIIMVTGIDIERSEKFKMVLVESFFKGAFAHVPKPFKMHEIKIKIKEALEKQT